MTGIVEPAIIPTAAAKSGRRIPVIWVIPLLAVLIGAWLAWNTLSKQGPTIRISFQDAEGLVAGQSQLKFKELTLGTVKTLELTPDHTRVVVTVGTTREAATLLSNGTIFWVVKPRLFAGSLSGLGTLVSGSFIGMRPGRESRDVQHDFIGLEDPPVLQSDVPGQTFTVKASRLGSISLGSPVFFRDLTVGEVLGWDLGDMAENASIHVFVRAPFDKYVHETSHFWNASGFSVNLGSGGVDVQIESLRAILLGGIAFDTPANAPPGTITDDHVFPLYASETVAKASAYGRKLQFVSYFTGSVKGLAPGADVTFHGLKVGQVETVDLVYDPKADAIVAPVTFEVEPERFVGVGRRAYANPLDGVNDLVARGLRATLESANLLTGQQVVAMQILPGAPAANSTFHDGVFSMPTSESGGFSGLASSAGDLLKKVNEIPFGEIGRSLAATLSGVDMMTNGPQIRQVLTALAGVMASAQSVLHQADGALTPALRQMPEVAAGLERTLTNANKLVLSMDSGYGDNTKFNRDLDRLLVQVDNAVQSVRSLTDLLSRHPEVLLRGRPSTGLE